MKVVRTKRFVQFHSRTDLVYSSEPMKLYQWYEMKEDTTVNFSEEREDDDGDYYTEEVEYEAICYVHPEWGFNAMKKEDLEYTTITVDIELDETA